METQRKDVKNLPYSRKLLLMVQQLEMAVELCQSPKDSHQHVALSVAALQLR